MASLCILGVLCVSVVKVFTPGLHHRDTENTKAAQRVEFIPTELWAVKSEINQVLTNENSN